MAQIQIADGHIPHLIRLSKACEIPLETLVDLIIASGIETLENWDEPIAYAIVTDAMQCTCKHFAEHGGCDHGDMMKGGKL